VDLAKETEDPKDLKNIGVTKEHVEPVSIKAYVLMLSIITGMKRELEFCFGFWENRTVGGKTRAYFFMFEVSVQFVHHTWSQHTECLTSSYIQCPLTGV
jgi:hypothetical protein